MKGNVETCTARAPLTTNTNHSTHTHRTPEQLGMSSSYYDMGQNPELAGSLWTTGEDYMKFLESLYYHRILPAEVCGLVWLMSIV